MMKTKTSDDDRPRVDRVSVDSEAISEHAPTQSRRIETWVCPTHRFHGDKLQAAKHSRDEGCIEFRVVTIGLSELGEEVGRQTDKRRAPEPDA